MSQKGFTLIELMVVIAIIAILSVLVYAPYNHYSNIAKVRFSAQKVEQAIDEAKTSVLGGYSFSGGSITRQNVHIGLVFSGSSNVIDMRGYPITMGTGEISTMTGELIRKIPLENNIYIVGDEVQMAVFLSPNGEMWTGSEGALKKDPISVDVSFKNANPGSLLRKTIKIGKIVSIE